MRRTYYKLKDAALNDTNHYETTKTLFEATTISNRDVETGVEHTRGSKLLDNLLQPLLQNDPMDYDQNMRNTTMNVQDNSTKSGLLLSKLFHLSNYTLHPQDALHISMDCNNSHINCTGVIEARSWLLDELQMIKVVVLILVIGALVVSSIKVLFKTASKIDTDGGAKYEGD